MAKRKRGVGRVYKRGNRWWIDYHGRRPDCSVGRIRQSGGITKTEAVEKLKERISQQARGQATGPQAERLTVDDLLDRLVLNQEVKRLRSVYRTKLARTQLLKFFGGRKALDVVSDDIDRYVLHRRKQGRADGTIYRELASLRRAYRKAVKDRLISHAPGIETPELKNARQGKFEEGDLRALLHRLPDWLAPWAEFSYLTGWRASCEAATLTWGDVDFESGLVKIEVGTNIFDKTERTTKNEDCKVWPFDARPRLEQLLRRQLAATRQLECEQGRVIKWVFHRDGQQLFHFRKQGDVALKRHVRDAWHAACNGVGLTGLQPHDLRRSFVTQAERAGVPRSVAMKLSGHRSERVYRRYAIAAERELRDGAQRLAAVDRTGTTEAHLPRKTASLLED